MGSMESLERSSDSSLIIGVAASTAERVHLARLLGEADALLLVSSADQARAFLELTGVTIAPSSAVLGLTAAATRLPGAPAWCIVVLAVGVLLVVSLRRVTRRSEGEKAAPK